MFQLQLWIWTWLTATALDQQQPQVNLPKAILPQEPYSPYSYPSPNATGIGGWDVAIKKARWFAEQLTIDEKVSICTGFGFPPQPDSEILIRQCLGGIDPILRVNFTGLCYADSATGIGDAHSYGTGFPPGITVASTFNRELMRARGYAIASELRVKGVHAVLGPVLALGRTVGGGTNYEGFGNDPYLIGAAGFETVTGHQAAGVQAEPKQYLGYDGQQYNRTSYSSNIDDKTIHEIEVWPYAEAIRAGAACVMTAYPYVNNSQASQNAHLINDILKTHLGFQGYTQSDWYALKSGVNAILAGTDQDMPGNGMIGANWSYFGANYTQAIKNGSVPEWRLTDAATRIMTPYFLLGQDRNYPLTNLIDDPRRTIADAQRQRHVTLAREVAAAGVVLLKNTGGKKGLPLVKPTTIVLFGPAAGPNPYGPNQYHFGDLGDLNEWRGLPNDPLDIGVMQGTVPSAGGTGSTFYPRLVDPLAAIQARAAQDLTLVDWSLKADNLTFTRYIARRATVCIPVVASWAGEGTDRNLVLGNNGEDMVRTVAGSCDNTIVVLQSPGPAWVDHPNITAILWANLGGQELGHALTDVLYGAINPSGRLPYTLARHVSDYAQPEIVKEPQPNPQINYTEGISVDYRGFELKNIAPRFWFGHGLSYSTFRYSDLQINTMASLASALETPINYVADAPGGDSRLYDVAAIISLMVTNEGPFDGTEIVQVYLQMPAEAENPMKVLRGFENVKIRDGETQPVRIYLTRKDISYWSVMRQTWVTPRRGRFTVYVGANAGDMRLQGTFNTP